MVKALSVYHTVQQRECLSGEKGLQEGREVTRELSLKAEKKPAVWPRRERKVQGQEVPRNSRVRKEASDRLWGERGNRGLVAGGGGGHD